MKVLGCTAAAVFLSAALVTAAEAKTGTCPYERILSTGSQALSFQVGHSFTLESFQGSLISYQRFVRDRTALRFGIGATADVGDTQHAAGYGGTDAPHDAGSTNWRHSYAVVAQLLRYTGRRPVAVYYGGGPKFTYNDRRLETTDYYLAGDGLEERYCKRTDRSWSLGVSGAVGVQWCVSRHFAFHAEYTLSAFYENSRDTYEERRGSEEYYTETADGDRFALQSDGVIFGLSAYF